MQAEVVGARKLEDESPPLSSATTDSLSTPPHSERERSPSFHEAVAKTRDSGDLTAYYAFSTRSMMRTNSSNVIEDDAGLSGFLEYRRLDGTWRPFLFQTTGFQLSIYRVRHSKQVTIMSTDMRTATHIALAPQENEDRNTTKLLKLGINGTIITLRAISHKAAQHWVEKLTELRDGTAIQLIHERPSVESEDDIFRQIDQLALTREWAAPTIAKPPLCIFCVPSAPVKHASEHQFAFATSPCKKNDNDEACCSIS